MTLKESEIISRLRKRSPVNDQVVLGIGDDAAVIKASGGKDLLLCSDLMVEGVHFRSEWTPPDLLGRKALAVNLSDIAAMGGVPKFALVSIALPRECSSGFIEGLFRGLFEMADASGVVIVGGDTSSSPDSLFIDVSVVGECDSGTAISRRGARIGDTVYVSGFLGASALGLSLLEDGFRIDDSPVSYSKNKAVLKHLNPEPQLKLGLALAEAGLATAMIDISDGLSTDLSHILDESGCGAVLHAAAIPIAECVESIASGAPGIDPLMLALHGGEEYELLFTCQNEKQAHVVTLCDSLGIVITAIGSIVAEKRLELEQNGTLETISPQGYQHLI
jgi:thiamine-monophosphate kinase